MASFSSRSVLITGATGGLGGAVVNAFLDAGATVTGVSRSVDGQHQSERLRWFAADLTKAAGAEAAVAAAVEHGGKLDVLAHVLGGFAGGSPTFETEEDVWDKMMTLNLKAAFLSMRAALPRMLDNGYGRIVAVGSRAGVDIVPGLSAYAVSKAGLNALVRTVAEEGKDNGITANVVLPSVIDTPANRHEMADADFDRWVTPEAIAGHVLWLASEEARTSPERSCRSTEEFEPARTFVGTFRPRNRI
ncbi:MAG: SDR family NAD(P)-dependent oxidoreductase [Bryobacterales bacterium]